MSESFEYVVDEMNNISDALIFISDSLECHASEGKSVNLCGLAYLAKLLGGKSSFAAEVCWGIGANTGGGETGSTE
ncbi:hypothetical protein [Maridesulfovibrio sp.]|uniref:hypothetical protein n=1 Tax=Maridesulfovibrio sp. TaxID=2795000 RepID=UPI0029F5BAAB|nr:hypothetical protein [Maridesulfovibrio sp.]